VLNYTSRGKLDQISVNNSQRRLAREARFVVRIHIILYKTSYEIHARPEDTMKYVVASGKVSNTQNQRIYCMCSCGINIFKDGIGTLFGKHALPNDRKIFHFTFMKDINYQELRSTVQVYLSSIVLFV
jgi:hypothetical protein